MADATASAKSLSATPTASNQDTSSSSVFITSTYPLTSIFTPPPECTHSWTFERDFYNSVTGGLLLQNAIPSVTDVDCFPTGFVDSGRAAGSQLYSPGICPQGYTTPVLIKDSSATKAVCCQSNFSYYTTATTVNHGGEARFFVGCLSTFPAGSTTIVRTRFGLFELTTGTVTGPITMWGQPITVAFAERDLSLFPSSVVDALSSPSGSAPSTITTPITSHVTETRQTANPQPSVTSSTLVASTSPPSNISSGSSASPTKIPILAGVAIGIIGLSVVAITVWLLWRRRRRKQLAAKHALPASGENSATSDGTYPETSAQYRMSSQFAELSSETRPVEMRHDKDRAELHAIVPVELQGDSRYISKSRGQPKPCELP